MVFDVEFWERFILNQIIPQATMFVENVKTRLLPRFDDIKKKLKRWKSKNMIDYVHVALQISILTT